MDTDSGHKPQREGEHSSRRELLTKSSGAIDRNETHLKAYIKTKPV